MIFTTIALTVLFAPVVVVPWKWRGVLLFFVLPWATAIGQYTLTAKWHRLSDTLAADGIALALAALASWWLQRKGSLQPYPGTSRKSRVVRLGRVAHRGAHLPGVLAPDPLTTS